MQIISQLNDFGNQHVILKDETAKQTCRKPIFRNKSIRRTLIPAYLRILRRNAGVRRSLTSEGVANAIPDPFSNTAKEKGIKYAWYANRFVGPPLFFTLHSFHILVSTLPR